MQGTVLLQLVLAARGVQSAPQEPASLAIANVAVIDVSTGELRGERTVVIQGERIAWVGPASEARIPSQARILDGSGKFLIPGLWDMHVHLPWNADEQVSLPLFLAHGVTGVREMGSDCRPADEKDRPCLSGLRAWRERIECGELPGPRLLALSTWPVTRDADLGGDPADLVESFVRSGADFVKVMEGLSGQGYFALVSAAREQALPVAGHVPLAVGMIEAARAGQVSIEHARDFLFDGFAGSAEFRRTAQTQNPPTAVLRRMIDAHDPAIVRRVAQVLAENGTRYVPTHVTRRFDAFADDEAYLADARLEYVPALRADEWAHDAEEVLARDHTPEGRVVLHDFYATGLGDTRTALDAGVEILAGTDANDSYVFPGSSLHDELAELVKAGLTPAQALRAATLAGARFLHRTEDFGSIDAGKKADLVLLRENPLLDISHTRSVETVVFGGRLYTREALDRFLAGVADFVATMNPEVELAEVILMRYVGSYDAPQGKLTITRSGRSLYLQPAGAELMRLRARSETEFAYLPQEASITFRVDERGEVLGLHFERGHRAFDARKTE